MASDRSLVDRLIANVRPQPVPGFAPPPREIAPDVFSLDRQLRMPGAMILANRTTIVCLPGGDVAVISPPPPDGEAFRAIDSIGAVRWIVAPNSFHYLYAPPFAAHYPGARLLVSPGLRERVPAFPDADEIPAAAREAWSGTIETAVLGPVRGLSETAMFHVPSKTLIVTDLAFNMTRFARRIDGLLWRLSGVPSSFGPSRTARLLLLRDRAEAGRFLREVGAWPFERIVMAHGDIVDVDAKNVFERAFGAYR